MDKSITIIDCNEIKVPFDLKIGEEKIHNTIIQGTFGNGMSKITALCDSYVKKGPYRMKKNKGKKLNPEIIELMKDYE